MSDSERAEAINNFYRTVSMNRLYYGNLLRRIRRSATVADAVIALGSSSAIAAWTLWQNHDGQILWQGVGGLAAVVGVLRPVLGLNDQVQRYGELFAGYTAVALDAENVANRMKLERGISDALWNRFESLTDRTRQLAIKDDSVSDEHLLEACKQQIERTIPVDELWWPMEMTA